MRKHRYFAISIFLPKLIPVELWLLSTMRFNETLLFTDIKLAMMKSGWLSTSVNYT